VDVLGARHARLEAVVHEEPPDLLVGHMADELLDVDPAIAERAAFLVGLGDLGLEGDDALQARLEVTAFHRRERYRTSYGFRPKEAETGWRPEPSSRPGSARRFVGGRPRI